MRSLKNDRRCGSTNNTLQWMCILIPVGEVSMGEGDDVHPRNHRSLPEHSPILGCPPAIFVALSGQHRIRWPLRPPPMALTPSNLRRGLSITSQQPDPAIIPPNPAFPSLADDRR